VNRSILIAAFAATGLLPHDFHGQVRAGGDTTMHVAAPDTMRVLWIAAHPDDEDTNFIAWLARGRNVNTAYMSLTRGDGGQNLIGNELGDVPGTMHEALEHHRADLDPEEADEAILPERFG